ncbi:MAG TPA: penicillin-binding protein activator [Rhizomicrobium sp.]|nr:penicillin-binding protein activator [Rhizomicrobium sp.]
MFGFHPNRFFAVATLALLAACAAPQTAPKAPPPSVAPPPPPEVQLNRQQPEYLRLPNLATGATPVRVGVILPFSSANAGTRALAGSMMKAAELAMFDSQNNNILLMSADEGSTPSDAADAARSLLAQGAEVIVGPLFGPSVSAVTPLAQEKGVPVLAFSTEKSVAGNGAYLISFLPQNEVRRVVLYAASQGHSKFAALVPQTPYGDVAESAFRDAVGEAKDQVVDVEHFPPNAAAVMGPATAAVKSDPDALLIAQGGNVLRAIGPALMFDGLDRSKVKLLGTGLWDDPSLAREDSLTGGWFAAPAPDADAAFVAKYRAAFGLNPAALASLAYDAVSLVSLLAPGEPYRRFTKAALMNPNGFSGVNGIFRFNADGTSERGLAVLEMAPTGPVVVDPAPKTFQKPAM